MEELAPELVPMLTSLEMPANFVPMTNAVLSEMARRGIARDRILATLCRMGSELPLGSLRLLQWAGRAGIDVRVLSDCNSLFIGHVLTGLLLYRPLTAKNDSPRKGEEQLLGIRLGVCSCRASAIVALCLFTCTERHVNRPKLGLKAQNGCARHDWLCCLPGQAQR